VARASWRMAAGRTAVVEGDAAAKDLIDEVGSTAVTLGGDNRHRRLVPGRRTPDRRSGGRGAGCGGGLPANERGHRSLGRQLSALSDSPGYDDATYGQRVADVYNDQHNGATTKGSSMGSRTRARQGHSLRGRGVEAP
jgi:hypothetical protein